MNANRLWKNDNLQFLRLLSELRACGISDEQYKFLTSSADLTPERVDELLDRAETTWEEVKQVFGSP
jgi:hypothetical protein